MTNLYILCGLPFSGKSMLGKEMSVKTGYTLISYDDVWQSLHHLDENLTYEKVLEDCKKQITDLLNTGFTVIYDSANPKEEHRQDIKKIADEIGLNTSIIYLKLPLEEIRRRREVSLIDKTHHVVSDENFNKAIEQLEEPLNAIVIQNEQEKVSFLDGLV